jgi:hypothetical protein
MIRSRRFSVRDFTLLKYRCLMEAIAEKKIPAFGVETWMEEKPSAGILIRHDVDRRPWNSLRMAELEAEFGIRATYYFRVHRGICNEEVIRRVAALGHEVGYHYEDLALANGCYEKALWYFGNHLEQLRRLVPVHTVAMHGSPFSSFDNRDLWRRHDLRQFGILGEAFLSINYSGVYYLTDTGRTWSETRANLRDRVPDCLTPAVASTDDFIRFVEKHAEERIAIVCHPERWDDRRLLWAWQLVRDFAVNSVKLLLSFGRELRVGRCSLRQ